MKEEKYGIGRVFKNNQNREFKIISKIGYDRRKVIFLDGYEVITGVSNISKGQIKHPEDELYKVGKVFKNKYNEEYIIIEKLLNGIRKIKFIDSDIEKLVDIDSIKNKTVNTKTEELYNVGKLFKTNEGYDIKVLKKLNNDYREVEFLNTNHPNIIVKLCNLKKGAISNPYHKSILNVGYMGIGKYNCKDYQKIYNCWRDMIRRCYEDTEKNPTYNNVEVYDNWFNFQTFAKWFEENFPYHLSNITIQLDKDLLQQNIKNKIYSSNTCVFLPRSVNNFIAYKNNKNTSGKIGVYKLKNRDRYTTSIREFTTGKQIFLGYYSNIDEASDVYTKARKQQAEQAKDYLRNLKYLPEEIIQLIK